MPKLFIALFIGGFYGFFAYDSQDMQNTSV